MSPRNPALLLIVAGIAIVGCGSSTDDARGGDRPHVVVTTNILGDVVSNIVGDDADIDVMMPVGTDPHEFQLSARQAANMAGADIIIANGLGFEEGLTDAIEAARRDGVPVHEVGPHVDPLAFTSGDDAGATDPHFFTDPERVADGAENIAAALAREVPVLDDRAVVDRAAAYADEIRAAGDDIARDLDVIPDADRKLVTDHEVFGYFADRYGFEVVGAVVPSGTTLAEPSSQELSDLADTIAEAGVPAVFTAAGTPAELAESLAAETGLDIEVVPLFSESLGGEGSGAETYLDMIRANADAIVGALT